jgi:ABC-2 type transport system permease protein
MFPTSGYKERTQPFWVQLGDLILIQLANWRWSWRGALLTGLVAPLLSTAALGLFARDSGEVALAYILTGNMVMSLLFGTFDRVAAHFAYMRAVGRLDFFATLPIYRSALIVATVIAFLALALPSLILTLAFGTLILDLPLAISPWLLVVVPLIGTSLCGLGALIGLSMETPENVGNISSLITFVLVGLGPVIIPLDRLPPIIGTISYLSPATYAASALRQTVLGLSDRIPLGVDLLVLASLLIVSLWAVGRKLDWRQG